MTAHYVRQFLRAGYEPGDGSMDGAQLVDGEWWHPIFGCDSLQMVVDRARALLAQPVAEGPTDAALIKMWATASYIDQPEGGLAFARAVLAKWGANAQ
jgi:hypothetical protein